MVQRLLLDRIDAEPGAAAIRGEYHLAGTILAHEAEAAVTWLQMAGPRTEIANHAIVVFGMPPAAADRAIGKMLRGCRWRKDSTRHDKRKGTNTGNRPSASDSAILPSIAKKW